MMYRVGWLQAALDQLTAAWLQATAAERKRINAASHQIDLLLRENPHGVGESRSGGRRITIVSPLVAIFRIEQDDQSVTVLHIRFSRGSRS